MLRITTLFTLLFSAAVMFAQNPLPLDNGGPVVTVSITSPASIAGTLSVGYPNFWVPTVVQSFSDTLAWGFTAAGDSLNCDSVVTDLSGLAGIARRGACAFVQKAQNMADAGATSFLICNNNAASPDEVITMGAAGGSLVPIPGVMVSFNDCARIAAVVDAGEPVVIDYSVDLSRQISNGAVYNFPIVPVGQAETPLLRTPLGSYFNLEPVDSIFNGTLSLTKPGGTKTVVGTTLDTILPFTSELIVFQDADFSLDAGEGEYIFEIASDLPSASPLEVPVTVSSTFFQTVPVDPTQTFRGARVADADYAAGNSLTYVAVSIPILQTTNALSYSFDICNVVELLDTVNNTYPLIEIDVIDPDANNDYVFDAGTNANGALTTFSAFTSDDNLIGFGEYEITGDETCDDGVENLITVPLEPSGVSADDIVLEAGKTYFVRLQGNSATSGSTVSPAFAGYDGPNNYFYQFIDTEQGADTLGFNNVYLEVAGGLFSGFTNFTFVQRLTTSGVVGTSQPALAGNLALSPNPASEFTVLNYALEQELNNGLVEIFNVTGQRVHTMALAGAQEGNLVIPTNNLPSGMYSVKVSTAFGAKTLQLNVNK